jgi:hypothetical protein
VYALYSKTVRKEQMAGQTKQNHYFVDALRWGVVDLGKLAAKPADYFLRGRQRNKMTEVLLR